MKLYDIPKESKIIADVISPDGKADETEITFHRLDGMYSYCTIPTGEVVHLSAVTPLVQIDGKPGYYRIDAPQTDEPNMEEEK